MKYSSFLSSATLACLLAGFSAPSFALNAGSDPSYSAGTSTSYVRIDGGYSFNHMKKKKDNVDHTRFKLKNNGLASFGVGYRVDPHVRTDITVSYMLGSRLQSKAGSGAKGKSKLSSLVGLLNFYYDIDNYSTFTPYVMAGAGIAHNKISKYKFYDANGLESTLKSGSKNNFAWTVGAGTAIYLQQGCNFDIGYNWIGLGNAKTGKAVKFQNPALGAPHSDVNANRKFKNLFAHQVRAGLRFEF